MKKLAALACSLALIVCALLTTGCSWDKVGKAEFVERPATTYTQATTTDLNLIKFTVKTDQNGTFTVTGTKASQEGVKVEINGFDVTSVGSRTATVKLTAGDVKYTLTFDYSVYASDAKFAGGTGISTNPYLVGTYEQFDNMLKESLNKDHMVYFKLISDIDFSGKPINQYANYVTYNGTGKSVGYLTAHIDGDNYKLKNIKQVVSAEEAGLTSAYAADYLYSPKQNEIFGVVSDFTLKNIEVNFVATDDYAASGLVTCGTVGSTVKFENVTTTGFIDPAMNGATSVATFIMQSSRITDQDKKLGDKSVFVNCHNRTDILNAAGVSFVAGFTTVQSDYADISFKDCTNEGVIEGGFKTSAGFVTCTKETVKALTFTGTCKNEGKIYKLSDAAAQGVSVVTEKFAGEAEQYSKTVQKNQPLTELDKVTVTKGTADRSAVIDLSDMAADTQKYATLRVVMVGGMGYAGSNSGGNLQFFRDIEMKNLSQSDSAYTFDSESGKLTFTAPALCGEEFVESNKIFIKPYTSQQAEYTDNSKFNNSLAWAHGNENKCIIVTSAYRYVTEGTCTVDGKTRNSYIIYVYLLDSNGKIVATSGEGVTLSQPARTNTSSL